LSVDHPVNFLTNLFFFSFSVCPNEMDLLTTFIVSVSILLVILILIITSDCDLTLRFFEKFGKKLSNHINKFMCSSNCSLCSLLDVFHGQVVWIVGASSGIGECLAYQMAANGAKVVLSARRKNELQKVKSQCLGIVFYR
jgi:dehydrogenase/reductase SDR family member 7